MQLGRASLGNAFAAAPAMRRFLAFAGLLALLFYAAGAAPLGHGGGRDRSLPGSQAVASWGNPSGRRPGRFRNTLFPHPYPHPVSHGPDSSPPSALAWTATAPRTASQVPIALSAATPSPVSPTVPRTTTSANVGLQPLGSLSSTTLQLASSDTTLPPAFPTSKFSSTAFSPTLTSSSSSSTTTTTAAAASQASSTLPHTFQLAFVNKLDSDSVHDYVTGLGQEGKVIFLTADGSFYYPPPSTASAPKAVTADIGITLAGQSDTPSVLVPAYVSSGRVWLSDGYLEFSTVDTQFGPALVEPSAANPNDPSHDVNWGFVEFTFNGEVGLLADLSYVDFVGMPLGMGLQTSANGSQSVLGMPSDAASQVCSLLEARSGKHGEPWGDLCVGGDGGDFLRVVSPSVQISNQATAFLDYWTDYVDQVFDTYATRQLTINTQMAAGDVLCTSNSSSLVCSGGGGTYTKPSAANIFGCNSGPFEVSEIDGDVAAAVVARLCAAFQRGTLELSGGNVQPSLPPQFYYTDSTCNWYSAFVHEVEIDHQGYAFPYDDVSPGGNANTAGIVSDLLPVKLTVTVGGAS